jgi:DNA-binding IclR family transcriptional regulator
VQLTVLDETDVVYVDRRESRNAVRIFHRIGQRRPAWDGSSSGKVLLAWLPSEELREFLPDPEKWPVGEPKASGSLDDFLERLAEVRERGFAINDEETEPGVWGVAAPIRDFTGSVVAAINLACLKNRVAEEKQRSRLVEATLQATAAASQALYFGTSGGSEQRATVRSRAG